MTKDEMLRMLKSDVSAWNVWREANANVHLRLRDAILCGVDLKGADLGEADLRGANFEDAELSGANLSRSNLEGADFTRANLQKANLYKADFIKAQLYSADLRGADLSRSNLMNADLSAANLYKANLFGANLTEADLSSASLTEANLQEVDMRQANLSGADLLTANFACANIAGTNFAGAWLDEANFTAVVLDGCLFADVDLSLVRGLETVIHQGPSTIGLDTLYRSNGNIPESFLREAGVPENFITQIPSLIGAQDGIQFYSCFISFSFKDQEFADRLHGRLRDAKLRVWYAPEDMQGGQKTHEQIETAIRVFDKLLLVVSEASLASEWVRIEIRNARRQERKTGKRKLFPVRVVDFDTLRDWECFDADSGQDLGVELREYYVPDFSTWKDHDKFEAEFKKLLRDLKADGARQT